MSVGLKMTRGQFGPRRLAHTLGKRGRGLYTFLLCLSSASLLSGTDTCEYFAMPGCAVGSKLLPIANVDVQVLEGNFDVVYVVFLLPSD